MDAGEEVTCTFTDQKRGRVVVVVDAVPNDAQDFSFTAGGGLTPDELLARRRLGRHAVEHAHAQRRADRHRLLAVPVACPPGWDQASATCSDGSPIGNINVGPDETVTCTFTNNKRGQIVVVKDAQPNDAAGLLLHGRRRADPDELLARRRLRRDALEHAHLHERRAGLGLLPVGDRPRAAGPSPPRSAATAAPSPTSASRPARPSRARSSTTSAGGSSSVKDAQPNDPQDFSFTAGGGLSPTSFQLDDDTDPALSNTRTFDDLVPRVRLLAVRDRAQRLGPDRARRATTAARSRTSTWRPARRSPAPSRTASAASSWS